MALDNNPKPYGLHDIKVAPYFGGSSVDLPSANKLMFKERIKSAEGTGDDMLSVIVSVREGVEWTLEATGLPLEALAIIYGVTLVDAGTTPNQTKSLLAVGGDRLPYFRIFGQSLGEFDDDVHCVIFKAKVTDGFDSPMEYGNLLNTVIKGVGIHDDTEGGIFEWIQNETATDLPSTFSV